MASGPVRIHLLLVHEFHFLVALRSHVVYRRAGWICLDAFVSCSLIPVFQVFVLCHSFLLLGGSHRNLRQVHSCSISGLQDLMAVIGIIDSLGIENF